MQNTMRFELSSRQIKIREILKKEFLELEIYAISDINPNRNQTHFTLESMQNALPNFKNKPIVASFNHGDFGSHDGKISYDKELDNEYWNVEGGEQILGWIRESDPVEIVEEKGVHWIKFRCALCVTYCYNQVKKLLKDRSKKVSVEVTIHQAEIVNGIEEIYDFTLNGVTILGTKNGKPVIEAIPNAHASILDKLDNEVFAEQRRVLSFAYQKMEGNDTQKSLKEEGTSVEKEVENMTPEENQDAQKMFSGEICPECGEPVEICKCAHCEGESEHCGETDAHCESGGQMQEEHDEHNAEEEHCESGGQMQEEHDEHNAEEEHCGENENCESAGQAQEGHDEHNATDNQDPKDGDDDPDDDPDDDDDDDDNDGNDERYQELENLKCELGKCNEQMAQLQERCTALEAENCSLKEELCKFADYEEIKTRMQAAEAKLQSQFCSDLKMRAIELMSSENIKDEDRTTIEDKCLSGAYSCEEDLKRDIAYAIYSARPAKTERYSVGIVAPTSVDPQQKEKDLSTMSREERIAERNKRGNKVK